MIGVVADDFTGGTDVAVAFRRAGLRVQVLFAVPEQPPGPSDADVVVVTLKTRTLPVTEAVEQTLAAARWLQAAGAHRLFFKYCSTFDSTPAGNIGPVSDALADLVGAPLTVVVPASPEHGRTQYLGHLFVGDQLLSGSPMRHHPLTPMTDARVAVLLQAQTERATTVVTLATVRKGAPALRAALDDLAAAGVRYAVVDALDADDLATIGEATSEHPLLTGAAGLAGGVGTAALEATDEGTGTTTTAEVTPVAVLAGSCSARTLEQLAAVADEQPVHHLDALADQDPVSLADRALSWYDRQPAGSAPVIASSLPPQELQQVQQQLGRARSSDLLETAMGLVARGLVDRGVRRLVVAGGETSGSVVTALGVRGGTIGQEEAPGVPWIRSTDPDVLLLLKSGNFGDVDLLRRAASSHPGAES